MIGALLLAAGAVVAVLLLSDRSPHSPPRTAAPTVTTLVPGIDNTPTLTLDAPPGSVGTIDQPTPPAPPVSWTLSGSCQIHGPNYICQVRVAASNGLNSAGFVSLDLSNVHGIACQSSRPLSSGVVTFAGSCPGPVTSVQGVYAATLGRGVTPLAKTNLPLSSS